jgi:hypothetical protein
MHDLFDRAAALRTFSSRRIRKLLYLFEFMFALLALIFVKRHLKTPSTVRVCDVILAESRKREESDLSASRTLDRDA